MHAIGASGYGKSKFLEWLMRWRAGKRLGFAVIDWHGTLYDDLLSYLAFLPSKPKVYLLEPSARDLVAGFNPFRKTGSDISVQVSQRIDATSKPWGAQNADETPQISQVLRMLYHFAAESGETLPDAALMLTPRHKALREYAARLVQHPYMSEQLADFATWDNKYLQNYVGSSVRRLDRFLALDPVRRMLGRADGNLDIRQIMDEGSVLLVNLKSDNLGLEAARLTATMLLNEFREAALARAGTKQRYVLVLDEFQEYITPDIAAMLEQVRKGGLSLILSHQHLDQLVKDETLLGSVNGNARIKVIFGGSDFEGASMFAKELFLPTINARQVEAQIVNPTTVGHLIKKLLNYGSSVTRSEADAISEGTSHTVDEHGDDARSTHGVSEGTSRTESLAYTESETETHLLMPILEDRVHSEQATDWQTKVSQQAQRIMALKPRQVFIKTPDNREGQFFVVRKIREYSQGKKLAPDYREKVMRENGALSPAEVDALMAKSRAALLAKCSPPPPPPRDDGDGAPRLFVKDSTDPGKTTKAKKKHYPTPPKFR